MKVFIFGTGNVATTLSIAIRKAGHEISGVYGRDPVKASRLASKNNCPVFTQLKSIPKKCDVYMIAISDDAISKFAKSLPPVSGIVVHTSGSTPLEALGTIRNKGVFYPVETIRKSPSKSFKKVPLCLEASNEQSLKKLLLLAGSISTNINIMDSHQRSVLHVAAVFTNNFTNHLIGIAQKLLHEHHLPFQLLEQLAKSTISNAFEKGADASQTGPAKRNDVKTINKHLSMLKNNKGAYQIYELLTNEIKGVDNKQSKK